ncbi:DgyrCDS4189 [Dimorphilus gyrociliatus]|uniref:DgyrCDS4189 n=1 Tax=Dimorphilus gyrociliatus TaxID=2664684 RepID=A0A7I8VIC1_9ANNE|nr:DgyrCDS4189 [Dimorphilus gyrociliatus]
MYSYLTCKDAIQQDGGYGWIIVFASFVLFTIADGIAFSVGQFEHIWTKTLGTSNAWTSLANSLFVSVPLICAPLSSLATHKFGCRKVTIFGGFVASVGFILAFFSSNFFFICLTYGFVSGLGLAFVYVPAVVIISTYFDKKLSSATGIALSGSGLGTVIGPPICNFLIETYSWRGCLLILAAVLLNICVCGALYRPLELHKSTSSETVQSKLSSCTQSLETLDKKGLKTLVLPSKRMWASCPQLSSQDSEEPIKEEKKICSIVPSNIFKSSFLIFCLCTGLVYMASDIPYIFNMQMAVEQFKFGHFASSYLTPVIGACNTVGQIFVGWLADKNCISILRLYMIYTCMVGLILITMPFCSNFYYLAFACAGYGWFMSADYALSLTMIVLILDSRYVTWATGLIYMCQGIGNVIGPPLAGLIIDETKEYLIAYAVSGSVIILAASLVLCIKVKKKQNDKQDLYI